MNRLFNLDNPFFVAMGRLADLFFLNMLCLVCCIPIITIGPSLSALFYVTLKMVRNEESYIARSFFHSFRQNLKQGILINVIMLLLGCILAFDYSIVSQMDGTMASVMLVLLLVVAFLYVLVFLYIYPILAKFYNTTRNSFRNAILMAIRHLPYTALMLVISACPLVVFLIPSASAQATILMLLILFGPAVIAYANSHFFVKIFDNYVPNAADAGHEASAEAELSENSGEAAKALTETVDSAAVNGGDPV